MELNILELAALAVLLIFAVGGYCRGFVRKLGAMISLVLSVALVSAFLPWVTDFLKESTPVYEMIVAQCEDTVQEQLGISSQDPLTRIEQTELIEELELPEFLKDILLEYNNEEGYRGLNVSGFQDYLVNFVATAILNVAAFVLAVFLVHLLLWFSISALDLLANLPVIRIVNRLAGLALGVVQALLLFWLLFLILSLGSGTVVGSQIMELVEKSPLLLWLYESNLFLELVLHASVFFGM